MTSEWPPPDPAERLLTVEEQRLAIVRDARRRLGGWDDDAITEEVPLV